MLSCSLKNITLKLGGLFSIVNFFSRGSNCSYSRGNEFIIELNLFNCPYFSLIGNLGSSNLSLFKSITPEC